MHTSCVIDRLDEIIARLKQEQHKVLTKIQNDEELPSSDIIKKITRMSKQIQALVSAKSDIIMDLIYEKNNDAHN